MRYHPLGESGIDASVIAVGTWAMGGWMWGGTMAQLAVAWAIHQPGCTHALVGARDTEQVVENAGAADINLSSVELRQIDSIISAFREEPE